MTASLKPISAQEVIQQNWDWFVRDAKPLSISANGTCQYRGFNQVRCTIGVVLPDELYDPLWDKDGLTIQNLLRDLTKNTEVQDFFSKVPFNLLVDLQALHDKLPPNLPETERVAIFANGLRVIATFYGLECPPASGNKI